jgi:protein TonB
MTTVVLSSSERGERLQVARVTDAAAADPYRRVLGLGYDGDKGLLAMFVVGAGVAQAAFALLVLFVSLLGLSAFAHDVGRHVDNRLSVLEVDLAPAEAPPLPVVAEPVAAEAPPAAKERAPQPKEKAPEPAAAPAQAAEALTAPADPDAPVDLTNTIVTGNAATYAGGNSANNGTSATPVRTTAAPGGVLGGTGTGPRPVDRSRGAGLLGSTDWNCSSFWPTEADVAQIDEAVVRVQVSVKADGTPQTVKVLSDPGSGFGSAAIRCAMRQRFRTALDHEGNVQPGTTHPFNVRFNR